MTFVEESSFPLALIVLPSSTQLRLRIVYDHARFGAADMVQLLNHTRAILTGMLREPRRAVRDIPLMSSEEQSLLLRASHVAPAEDYEYIPVFSLFTAQAEAFPSRHALRCGDMVFTYRDLDRRTNQISALLHARGIGQGSLVVLCLPRCAEYVACMLGVLKTGAAYIPIDASYPTARIEAILRDANAQLVIGNVSVPALPNLSLREVFADSERYPDDGLATPPRADALAYIVYTSGSTGAPRGVCVTHGNLSYSTSARLAYYRGSALRSFLLLSSFSFDSSVAGIYWTLSVGGTLHVPSEETAQDLAALTGTVSRYGISHILCIPSLYHALLETDAAQLTSLNTVIVAGEACPVALVETHRKLLPKADLFNEYGPTECTVWSTVHNCLEDRSRGTVPIGRPIPGTHALVMDRDMRLLPQGVAGELCIAGPGVAAGYHRQESVWQRRLVASPSEAGTGETLYRTGDRVRLRCDGTLEFLGRLDGQVKVRGIRIECAEVERILLSHGGVGECAVVPISACGEDAAEGLAAYVVPIPGQQPELREFKRHLLGLLPRQVVPEQIVLLDRLPRLPNGKVDTKALAPERTEFPGAGPESRENWSDAEQALARVVRDVSGLDILDREADLFDQGVHSLHAMRILSRAREYLKTDLRIVDLYEGRSIAGILARADRRTIGGPVMVGAARGPRIVALQESGSLPPLFIMHGAGGVMAEEFSRLLAFLGPDQPAYMVPPIAAPDNGEETWASAGQRYREEVRAVRPGGPIALLGFCSGGNLAYEVARQMCESKDPPIFLGVIDAYPLGVQQERLWNPIALGRMLSNLYHKVRHLPRMSPEKRRALVSRNLNRVRRLCSPTAADGKISDADIARNVHIGDLTHEHMEMWRRYLTLTRNYRELPIPMTVDVFRSKGQPAFSPVPYDLGWGKVAEAVRVSMIDCPHHEILHAAHAPGLARALDASLRAAAHRSLHQASIP